MADLERKIKIDISEIKQADKEYKNLEKNIDDNQKKITNSAKRESNKRDKIVRDTLAKKTKRIRKASNKRVSLLKETLNKNLISEQQFAKKVEKIQAKSRAKISKTRSRSKAGGGGIGKLGGLGKAFLGGAIVSGISIAVKGLARFASSAIDATNKIESFNRRAKVVFGESLPLVEIAANDAAAAMGLTRTEFVATASATADLLVPLGATRAVAAEMSVSTLELAAALKEFNGDQRSTAEVAGVLTKSFLGEREGLKSLGISISEADIKQQLLARGTQNLTGKALQMEKALITQELLLEKSADAMTSYADATGSGQQESNKLSAEWKELIQSGNAIISSVFLPLVGVLTGIVRAINSVIKGFKIAFNIANAQGKQQQQQIVQTVVLQKELLKLSKIKNKSIAQQKQEIKVQNQLADSLDAQGVNVNVVRNNVSDLLKLSKKTISQTKQQIKLEIKQKQTQEASAISRIANFKTLLKQGGANATGAKIRLARAQKTRNDLTKEISLRQQTLKLINLQGKTQKAQKIQQVKIPTISRGRSRKPKKEEFVRQDTTLEEQIAEQDVIQQRLAEIEQTGLQGRLEKQALLREQARLDELIGIEEQATTLDTLETERENIRESIAQTKSAKEKKRLQEQLKLKQIEVRAFLNAEKAKSKIIAENEKVRQKIEQVGFEFGQALLSNEDGAFRKFLANQFRSFVRFLADKASAEAGIRLAAGDFVGAGALTAGAIALRLGAEVGAKAIEGDQSQKQPTIGDISVPQTSSPSDVSNTSNTTINNIDNSVKVEVIETGTYFTESQMIRDRISPLLQQLDDSRGALQQ